MSAVVPSNVKVCLILLALLVTLPELDASSEAAAVPDGEPPSITTVPLSLGKVIVLSAVGSVTFNTVSKLSGD